MASALQLNAQATIINGHGFDKSPALVAAIKKYQAVPTVKALADVCKVANAAPVAAVTILAPVLGTLGSKTASFLIDFYPTGTSPSCSTSAVYYVSTPTPIYGPPDYEGNRDIIGYTYTPVAGTGSLSQTVTAQAALPFANGLSGFANVYTTSSALASGSFDTTSSINILKDKTYGQSGLGFNGPTELSTGGVGANGGLIASVIKNWGTLFDIRHFTTCGDPYVFGQYLLNHNLGKYGLTDLFIAAGLNLGDLTKVPQSTTTQSTEAATASVTGYVGAFDVPSVSTVTTTTTVTASSPAVMHDIYKKITGSNLSSIISATGFKPLSANKLTTLDDYLTLANLVDAGTVTKLKNIGITDFDSFGMYLQKIIGRGTFESWDKMATFLSSIVVPQLSSGTAPGKSTTILSSSTISTLQSQNVAGSGDLGQAVMSDFLGACAGMPYTDNFNFIADTAGSIGLSGVTNALNSLKTAVSAYINAGPTSDPESGSQSWPAPTAVTAAVASVNSALNSVPTSDAFKSSSLAYTQMVNQMKTEVNNLTKAHVVFNAGSTTILNAFAGQIGSLAQDSSQSQSFQFISNVVTADAYGDTIKSAIAESVNTTLLMTAGISVNNDPQPASALIQAKQLGVPPKDFISQNYG
jgi:hypothetical protein